ncbi:unnamed protein product [marine sediment metagenome]|uniref:Uncharacterized protein n=1 Tax=marine sediment metagenome TaxID=412755 RepID=X1M4B9_9ZZZZ
MEHKIKYDCECEDCKGTGIYRGIGEGGGFGVVCHSCGGTGEQYPVITYRDFEGRQTIPELKRVLQTNPGIGAGVNEERGLTLESFGGMPYEDWLQGKPFPPGSEMRGFTCPAWWYQSADYNKKPKWDECVISGTFSSCEHFPCKERCWEKWDKEFGV